MSDKTYSNADIEDLLLKESFADDENRAIFAVRAMKNYFSPKILERLIDIIENEKNSEMVICAIYSLGTKPPIKSVLHILKKQLLRKQEGIRAAAMKVLSEYGDLTLRELDSLLTRKEELPLYSQKSVIWLLGQIGSKETYDYLNKWKGSSKIKDLDEHFEDALRNLKRKVMKISLEGLVQRYRKQIDSNL